MQTRYGLRTLNPYVRNTQAARATCLTCGDRTDVRPDCCRDADFRLLYVAEDQRVCADTSHRVLGTANACNLSTFIATVSRRRLLTDPAHASSCLPACMN